MRCIVPYFCCFTRSFSSFDIRICGCCWVTMSNSLSVWLLCVQTSSNFHCVLECVQIYLHWVCDATWPSHPLPPSSPFAFNLSQHQRLFQWVGSGHQVTLHITWPKYWSFSFSISPSNEYSGLISFRIDWFDLLAVQGTINSLNHNSKSTNSLVLSLLHGPTLTSIHDCWKNHSFDNTDLCQQSDASAF